MHGGERIGTLPRLPYTGFTCIYRATNDQVLRNVTDITVSRSYTEDAFIVCPLRIDPVTVVPIILACNR